MYTQRSFVQKSADATKKWYIIDGTDKVVGRLATEIADVLRGKNKTTFTSNTDCGDFVVVVNAEKLRFTGNKLNKKIYYRHTNHVGGLKQRTAQEQFDKHPELVLEGAVKGMLPKTSLGRKQLTKLKVVIGPEHKFEAQKPEAYEV
jgi:large subunit ribosomal protein L13